jgi:hypothetical protein
VLKKPLVEISEAEYDEMTAVNSSRILLPQGGRQASQRQRQDLHAGDVAARRVHAVLCGLCRHQGAGRTFHARGLENSAPRHFGDGDRPRPDGHAVLLSGGRRGCVAYHKTAAALSSFTRTGLTDIHDIVPWIRFLVSDGWWMTGQTILVNGGYTTK